ncbi:MAG: cysteine desulfurase, partial [Candidatus Micrarchaeota archaeon]
MLDVEAIRKDFPILSSKMNGKQLVYLDNAATTQKPRQVINAIEDYYTKYNANIHRGIYKLAEEATAMYEESKKKVADFIGADGIEEVVYTRNATESLNLVAIAWGEANIEKGDHILISEMEHHSNMVPWQLLAKRKGAYLDYIKINDDTSLNMQSLKEELEKKPKVVSLTHVSNVTGTINDIKEIAKLVHETGALFLVDGAQSVPHMKINVKDLGCDMLAFSGHKMLGPTGIGVLYAKKEILEAMPPFLGGGDMIKAVSYQSAIWNDLPWKFEAGTSNIEGGIGLGAAIDYINKIGIEEINKHEKELTRYALERISEIKNVDIFGYGYENLEKRAAVISFSIKGVHPHDIAQVFDKEGIAIRAGHHCAMPLVKRLVSNGSVARMSFYLYNTKEEIDKAIDAIIK